MCCSDSETKSVARIRLAKTENPSACGTVNCKVCSSAIAQLLPVVPSFVHKVSINPIVQRKTRLISHTDPYTWQYYRHFYSDFNILVLIYACVLWSFPLICTPPKDGLNETGTCGMNKTRNKPDILIWRFKCYSNIDSMPESELYQHSYVEFYLLCIFLSEKITLEYFETLPTMKIQFCSISSM
jgi:hypothetical protein